MTKALEIAGPWEGGFLFEEVCKSQTGPFRLAIEGRDRESGKSAWLIAEDGFEYDRQRLLERARAMLRPHAMDERCMMDEGGTRSECEAGITRLRERRTKVSRFIAEDKAAVQRWREYWDAIEMLS